MDHFLNLRIFVGLVELESFSRTALELGLSPATVTTRLVQLETYLGVSLVQRNTRGLKITEEGEELYVGARQLLQDLQKLEARFYNSRDVAKGRLRISLPPIIASCMLLPELSGFQSAYPDVHVELNISTRFVDLVQEGFDCAIRVGDLKDSNLVARALGFHRFVTVVSPDYSEVRGVPTSVEELAQHACISEISNKTGRPKPWIFCEDGNDKEVTVSGTLTVHDAQTAIQAAAFGLGVAQTVRLAADGFLRCGKIQEVLSELSALGPYVQLVYPKSLLPSRKLKSFIEFCLQVAPKYLVQQRNAPDSCE